MEQLWDTVFLKKHLIKGGYGQPLIFHQELGSTNTVAMELAREGAHAGTVVLAETQYAGRGRREKQWHSPAGTGIWMSLIVAVPPVQNGDRLCNMACAVAVTDALREKAGVDAGIKWPNDIWIGTRKISGILIEAVPGRKIFIAGIGVNINQQSDVFPQELLQTATSLQIERGYSFSREEIMIDILARFTALHTQLEFGEVDAVVRAYNERSFLLNKSVSVGGVVGIAQEVRANGAFVIRDALGVDVPLLEGEIRFDV